VLRTDDLHVGYHSDLDVLRGVNVRAKRGEVTAILGANGVGKSTLLKAVFGYLRPRQGRVLLDDRDVTATPPHAMVQNGISYSPQQPGVFGDMSVEENILLGGWVFRKDSQRLRRRLAENFDRFPVLKERRQTHAVQLSGGQRRMVELARALMPEPTFLLVDEPSAGLAPQVADGVYEVLRGLASEGVGVVLVDQDIPRALALADYVFAIDLGKNRLEGSPAEIGDVETAFWTWGATPGPGT
jgi:branched-chain amino acid transport system ATP-binding protein